MVALHFDKLYHYIMQHGFILKQTYTLNGKCFLLELVSKTTVQTMYLCLAQYECITPYEAHALVPSASNEEPHIPVHLLESSYSDLNNMVQLSTQGKGTVSVESHIKDKYKRHVLLNDAENDDRRIVQSIEQQLERLQYTVRGIQYSVAIAVGQHIGVLQGDDIQVFKCPTIKALAERTWRVVADLDVFYDKIATIDDDCDKVMNSLEQIFVTNQTRNTKSMVQIISQREHVLSETQFLRECNEKYNKYLAEYLPVVEELNQTRREKEAQLEKLRVAVSTNIHQEMRQSHQRAILTKDLESMSQVGDKLYDTISTIRRKNQNILLRSDALIFSNIVLLDQLFRNLDELKSLKKKL